MLVLIYFAVGCLQALFTELRGSDLLYPFPEVCLLLFLREVKVGKIPDLNGEVRGCDLTLIDIVCDLVLIHSEVPDQHKEEEDDEEINADDNEADITLAEDHLALVQHIFERELA